MDMRKSLGAVGLVALLLPLGSAAPVDLTMDVPDLRPYLPLVPDVQGGSIAVSDGVLNLQGTVQEFAAVAGAVRVRVPWSFVQDAPLPDGYYREAYARVYAVEDGVVLGYQEVRRTYTGPRWDERGTLVLDVQLSGVEARHEVFLYLYASYYSSYPYRSVGQEAAGAFVATGPPLVLSERVTTAPLLRGPRALAVDLRDADFQPHLGLTANFTLRDTAVTPDRFAVLQVPYRFQRATAEHGYGYEYGGVSFYAYDQDGRYLGSTGMGWYRDHPYDSLALDLQGTLSYPLQFHEGSEVRREVIVQVSMYWYGYVCPPDGRGCGWFYENQSPTGLGGLVYTLPAQLPDTSQDAVVRRALDLL